MNTELDALLVFLLLAPALVGLLVAYHIAKRLGRFLNFRSLIIVNYVLVGQVSGLVHLAQVEGASRGYFDILASTELTAIESATLNTNLGLAALCLASAYGLPRSPDATSLGDHRRAWLLSSEKKATWLLVLVLLPITMYSLIQIRGYVQNLDATRVIAVAEGFARHSFIAAWAVWVIALAAIAIVSGRLGRSRSWVTVIGSVSMLAIVATLSWSGGRSIVVVMALPLLLLLLPKLDGIRWLAIPAAIAAAASYILAVTETRSIGSGSQFATWLDWEWGRFSLLGFAQQHVEDHGYLYGETFAAGVSNVLLGAMRLVGVNVQNLPLRMSMNITGEDLLGSSTAIHVVPGMSAELFMNFGSWGVFVGYLILGKVTAWADTKYSQADGAILQLTFAYIGSLLVFRTISADSGSIYSYVLYTGFPLLALAFFSCVQRRADKDRTYSTQV